MVWRLHSLKPVSFNSGWQSVVLNDSVVLYVPI